MEEARAEGRLPALLSAPSYREHILYNVWCCRDFYFSLSPEEIVACPELAFQLSLLHLLGGDVSAARDAAEKIDRQSSCAALARLILPVSPRHEIFSAFRCLMDEGYQIPTPCITADRPSVLNGLRDFTPSGKYLARYRTTFSGAIRSLCGERGECIYKLALAEYLYRKNHCFEALTLLVGTIPFLERVGDVHSLFAALTMQLRILLLNGQAASAAPIVDDLRRRVEGVGCTDLSVNLNAMEVRSTLYDGRYDKLRRWLDNEAPEDFQPPCLLNSYCFLTKLCCYLLLGRHLALFSLAGRLRPLLTETRRYLDLCELELIVAMCHYRQGEKGPAFVILDRLLPMAERFGYDRTIGDEGEVVYRLLMDYAAARGETPYLRTVTAIAQDVALYCPDYLKPPFTDYPSLTAMEQTVLRLLAQERTNADICTYLNIKLPTVKYHIGNLLRKLDVSTRGQAVKRAIEIGLLEQ